MDVLDAIDALDTLTYIIGRKTLTDKEADTILKCRRTIMTTLIYLDKHQGVDSSEIQVTI
tara:strand:+ start:10025 stop:10204 length:180 start_codon:yes stop_codon:yes gene_type:complete